MNQLEQQDIHIIARNSNLSEETIDVILKENIYNSKENWEKFLQLFFISLGIGFTISGIIFFFAYNWDELHKFVKIALTEGLLFVSTLLIFLPRINLTVKKIFLTGSSILVGVLFAVFGQIYQTGANAYDFFLAWTVFIGIWTLISNFAPLWLIFLLLINTTFTFYVEQVGVNWSIIQIYGSLYLINSTFCLLFISLSKLKKISFAPNWFLNILSLVSIFFSTTTIILGIFDSFEFMFLLVLVASIFLYSYGIWIGNKEKNSFYLSIIPFSVIIICSALLIKISDDEVMFLMVGIFIVSSISLVIGNLLMMHKKKKNEK